MIKEICSLSPGKTGNLQTYQLPILYKELMSVVYKKEQKVITKTSEGI